MSTIRLVLVLTLLSAILLGLGYLFGGFGGITLALIISLVLNFATYWYSDKFVLALYRAKPLKNEELERIVRKLSNTAKIPMPRLYVVEMDVPNAFATGRDPKHAAVAVTTGLMKILNKSEIEAVLSHEISHIKNRDTLVATVSATLATAISWLAELGRFAVLFGRDRDSGSAVSTFILLLLTPFIATILYLALSRSREYLADASGARLLGSPKPLADALLKISSVAKVARLQGNTATANLWFINPFNSGAILNLLSTHPPIEKRVERLMKMKIE